MRLLIILFAVLGIARAQDPSLQTGTPHPFVCADYVQGKIFIVSKVGKVEWSHAAPSCDDLWVLPNNNLLFVTGHGVKEVSPKNNKVVFSYESKSEIYACQRLPNGNTFVGECNAGRLLEVAKDGTTIVKEIKLLPEGQDGGHAYMRNARVLANGHYLVTHCGAGVVKEYDPTGKIVREIPAPGGPHSVVRLPDGNTLIAIGDAQDKARVIEVDAKDKIVWEVTSNDLPGIKLAFMTGLQRLPNGNTVMSNWLGHGKLGQAPHLIEVTRDKKIVWTFADHQTFKTIASVVLLDVPGDCIKGKILH